MTTPHESKPDVIRYTTFDLLDENRFTRSPVLVDLIYCKNDPCAVTMALKRSIDDRDIIWAFGRDLLAKGLDEVAGDGDMHIRTFEESPEPTTKFNLDSPEGHAELTANTNTLRAFLEATYTVVPPDQEGPLVAAALESFLAETLPDQ